MYICNIKCILPLIYVNTFNVEFKSQLIDVYTFNIKCILPLIDVNTFNVKFTCLE